MRVDKEARGWDQATAHAHVCTPRLAMWTWRCVGACACARRQHTFTQPASGCLQRACVARHARHRSPAQLQARVCASGRRQAHALPLKQGHTYAMPEPPNTHTRSAVALLSCSCSCCMAARASMLREQGARQEGWRGVGMNERTLVLDTPVGPAAASHSNGERRHADHPGSLACLLAQSAMPHGTHRVCACASARSRSDPPEL